jgi:hypothetical protein
MPSFARPGFRTLAAAGFFRCRLEVTSSQSKKYETVCGLLRLHAVFVLSRAIQLCIPGQGDIVFNSYSRRKISASVRYWRSDLS